MIVVPAVSVEVVSSVVVGGVPIVEVVVVGACVVVAECLEKILNN